MSLVSIGDLAQSFLLRRQNVALKSDLQRLSGELTTGRVADVAARLSGDLVPLSGLDASLSSLRAYRAVNSEAALFTGVMQTALGRIDSLSLEMSRSLNLAGTTPSPVRLDAVAAEARRQFDRFCLKSTLSVLCLHALIGRPLRKKLIVKFCSPAMRFHAQRVDICPQFP